MYCYHSWGLRIASTLLFSGWPSYKDSSSSSLPEIRIESGAVPKQLLQPKLSRALLQITQQDVLIILPGVARVLVQGGEKITVQTTAVEPDPMAMQLLLESNAIPALLIQRGLSLLCGSAVALDGQAIAILGQTGIGTSTLAAALAFQGAEVLADGYCVISTAGEPPEILPGPAQINLWGQAFAWLGQSEAGRQRLRPGRERFRAAFPQPKNTAGVPLQAIYHLDKQHDGDTALTGQKALQRALELRQNPFVARACGRGGAELVALGKLLQIRPFQAIDRPRTLAEVASLREEIHRQVPSSGKAGFKEIS